MKNCRKNALKSRKGITLIALVITIIVLLILAGISISMLSGDNSILQKATDAKDTTEAKQIEERARLAYTAAIVAGKGNITEPLFVDELDNEFGENGYNLDTDGNECVVKVDSVERLRVNKGTTTTANTCGPQSDGSFVGKKLSGKNQEGETVIANTQKANPTADG